MSSCTWDLTLTVNSWTTTADYSGTITQTAVLTVNGNIAHAGGTWTSSTSGKFCIWYGTTFTVTSAAGAGGFGNYLFTLKPKGYGKKTLTLAGAQTNWYGIICQYVEELEIINTGADLRCQSGPRMSNITIDGEFAYGAARVTYTGTSLTMYASTEIWGIRTLEVAGTFKVMPGGNAPWGVAARGNPKIYATTVAWSNPGWGSAGYSVFGADFEIYGNVTLTTGTTPNTCYLNLNTYDMIIHGNFTISGVTSVTVTISGVLRCAAYAQSQAAVSIEGDGLLYYESYSLTGGSITGKRDRWPFSSAKGANALPFDTPSPGRV